MEKALYFYFLKLSIVYVIYGRLSSVLGLFVLFTLVSVLRTRHTGDSQ